MNAHSSRSHAILSVQVDICSPDKTRTSTVSAIDLAGSEDNRRTENDKVRMVESASINKSLFVLAQCVEAMTTKQTRIPYRESKMTRILSLGQNNGFTVMILNLAPVRSYHLDTLSSLNVASRTRKIEVREVENDPMFKGPVRPSARRSVAGSRQPLRPLTAASANVNLPVCAVKDPSKKDDEKPTKAFSVYSDRPHPNPVSQVRKHAVPTQPSLQSNNAVRSLKLAPLNPVPAQSTSTIADLSAAEIEEMVEKKVEKMLAVRALSEQSRQNQVCELNDQVQRRLALLEQRIEGTEDARAEGLSYLLMAKQHQARGENRSALKMYQLALPHFPHNAKLVAKIATLKRRTHEQLQNLQSNNFNSVGTPTGKLSSTPLNSQPNTTLGKRQVIDEESDSMDRFGGLSSRHDTNFPDAHRPKQRRLMTTKDIRHCQGEVEDLEEYDNCSPSPRTMHLLSIVNSRDVSQIKLLKGVGMKKAEAIVDCLCGMDQVRANAVDENNDSELSRFQVSSLTELSMLRGIGIRSVETMRSGIIA